MPQRVYPNSVLLTKVECGWIKVLSLKGDTLKLIKEYVGDYLCDLNLWEDFLNKTLKGQTIKGKNDDFNHIKIEDFCCFMNKVKDKCQNGEDIGNV